MIEGERESKTCSERTILQTNDFCVYVFSIHSNRNVSHFFHLPLSHYHYLLNRTCSTYVQRMQKTNTKKHGLFNLKEEREKKTNFIHLFIEWIQYEWNIIFQFRISKDSRFFFFFFIYKVQTNSIFQFDFLVISIIQMCKIISFAGIVCNKRKMNDPNVYIQSHALCMKLILLVFKR